MTSFSSPTGSQRDTGLHPGGPDSSADTLIELGQVQLNLRSGAGEVNILRGIDLTVPAGESVSIVGPSGAGKSTLMMLMAGLERATSGSVRVAGQELGGMSEDQLALFRRARIGIVFQAFRLVPTMSALENVAIPLELAGAADAFERAEEGLRAVGLGHRLTHYPDQLSGGEQQRVALARAFVAGPSLLLADEPTGNLDGTTGAQVIDLMFDLKRRHGTTLVLITHDLDLAQRCDRIVHLTDGLISADEYTDAASRAGERTAANA
ncbi:MAG: ABC transporter ATP-binding protein [Alphaproteobacteria bacterium]|nr:ABC transporter ATP-binding protein [Alphaproteobacteria bacterium]MBU0798287.1 ABC transporter ATP-binding protein [Alphaproteobacteria bacterium]MBU0889135.1 ABC transporter ATP-binding protein [Alphaproteobacteria bacterium]MBU1812169.1 ABC transporter ATP-binding protein [Alphaproteobacteria bacterium]MBU2091867.1 ABC transporter ATP-binding protein [Alphaproteobacteria bacterium]